MNGLLGRLFNLKPMSRHTDADMLPHALYTLVYSLSTESSRQEMLVSKG